MPTPEQQKAVRKALLSLAPSGASSQVGYTYHRSQMFHHAVNLGDVNMACAYATHCKVLDVEHIRSVLTLILK